MNLATFFSKIRVSLFGGKLTTSQVSNIEHILKAFNEVGDGREKTLAYALATAYHEVGSNMTPVREGFASTDKEARAKVLKLRRAYANPIPPYNHVYYGRGYVQLTWAKNYQASIKDAGIDIFRYPDEVLKPEIGAKLLILGLQDGRWNGRGKGISFYLPDNGPDDKMNARRTVNITDRWSTIAGYYDKFLEAIRSAGGISEKEEGIVEEKPKDEETDIDNNKLLELVSWRANFPENELKKVVDYLQRMP